MSHVISILNFPYFACQQLLDLETIIQILYFPVTKLYLFSQIQLATHPLLLVEFEKIDTIFSNSTSNNGCVEYNIM